MNHECKKPEYKRSKREHKRPPRFFVVCSVCSNTFQATLRDGYLHIFTTNYKRSDKRPRSFRVDNRQREKIAKLLREGKI